jgi:hypothetical protein
LCRVFCHLFLILAAHRHRSISDPRVVSASLQCRTYYADTLARRMLWWWSARSHRTALLRRVLAEGLGRVKLVSETTVSRCTFRAVS